MKPERRWIDALREEAYVARPFSPSAPVIYVSTEKEALNHVVGEILLVYVGTYMSRTSTPVPQVPVPQVTLANCRLYSGNKRFQDVYIRVFTGPREEAIEVWRAHRKMLL